MLMSDRMALFNSKQPTFRSFQAGAMAIDEYTSFIIASITGDEITIHLSFVFGRTFRSQVSLFFKQNLFDGDDIIFLVLLSVERSSQKKGGCSIVVMGIFFVETSSQSMVLVLDRDGWSHWRTVCFLMCHDCRSW
jgi:hypothetical protein